jgi:AcrR family transcriptional regulator
VEVILRATAHILVRHGYEGANTNRIAEEAGVSIGSLYQYFPNKEALVAALVERHCEQMWRFTLEHTASVVDLPVERAVREVIGALFAAHAVEPRLHKVLQEQVPRVGKMGLINDLNERCVELVRGYLDARRGEILPHDRKLAAFVIVHTIEALSHAALDKPEYLLSGKLVDETTALVVRYLTAKSPPAAGAAT